MYSYVDTAELAPDIDALTHERGPVDTFGRDDADFARDCDADSLDEYAFALLASIDSDVRVNDEKATARASVGACESSVSALVSASFALAERVTDARRALFDDAVTRYIARIVDGRNDVRASIAVERAKE